MSRRLYRVTVTHDVYVVATSHDDAERWTRANITEWNHERLDNVHAGFALPTDATLPRDESLPWCADGIPDEAVRWTCADWVRER